MKKLEELEPVGLCTRPMGLNDDMEGFFFKTANDEGNTWT